MVIFLGGLQATAYVVMTLLVIVWALFSAPTWCGAVNRQRGGEVEYCRNNSFGLLLGCWIRQHKFQHFTSAWWITFHKRVVDHQLAGSDARNLGGRAGKACNYFSRVRHYHWNNRRNG